MSARPMQNTAEFHRQQTDRTEQVKCGACGFPQPVHSGLLDMSGLLRQFGGVEPWSSRSGRNIMVGIDAKVIFVRQI